MRPFIAISGVDCSGKSTQISALAACFERVGYPVEVFWYRPGYGPELDALRKAVRRLRPGALPSPGKSTRRTAMFTRPQVAWPWVGMAVCDTLLQYAAKVRVARLRGAAVICDRYVADALIDLELQFPPVWVRAEGVIRAAVRACPVPDVHLLLTLDDREASERAAIKQEPFADPPALRLLRNERYLALAESPTVHVVDAGRSIEDVHRTIVTELERRGVLNAGR